MGEQCELRRIERTMEASIQRRALAQSRSGLYSCDVTHTEPSLPDRYTRLRAALANRYRLDRELGRGGMATVYLAHDLKHDRPVAIKVLRPEVAAALGAERFLREIVITARLDHPHILTLIDSGDADGFLFYVVPY